MEIMDNLLTSLPPASIAPLLEATTTTSPLFGVATTTATPSLLKATTATLTTPLFGATTTTSPLLEATTTTSTASLLEATTTTPLLFGVTTTTSSLLEATTTTSPLLEATTSTAPLFGATTTTSSLLEATITTSTASLLEATTTTSLLFGATTTTTSLLKATTTTTSPLLEATTTILPLFGAATTTSSLLEATTKTLPLLETTTTKSPLFGAATTKATPLLLEATTSPSLSEATTTERSFWATTTTPFFKATTTARVDPSMLAHHCAGSHPSETSKRTDRGIITTSATRSRLFPNTTALINRPNSNFLFQQTTTTSSAFSFNSSKTVTLENCDFGSKAQTCFSNVEMIKIKEKHIYQLNEEVKNLKSLELDEKIKGAQKSLHYNLQETENINSDMKRLKCKLKLLSEARAKLDLEIEGFKGEKERVLQKQAFDEKCPVCFELMRKPRLVYQCSNGHVFCSPCHNKMHEPRLCPICRVRVGCTPIRCLVLERLINES